MDKRGDFRGLLGRSIDGRYKLESLIRQTSKSWVFKATEEGELSPHRNVAVKILKPWLGEERRDQFSREVDRLANLEEHPNITTMYSAGRDGRYFYVAMELVPGKDLDQEIKSGKTFSLEEILNIMEDISEASDHINKKECGHHDLKLKNIKIREEERKRKTERTYVLDLGGRLRKTKNSNDVYKLGIILRELLDHQEYPQQKIPRGLENIVQKSMSSDGYASPEDFKNAIETYRRSVKKGISRRKFLKLIPIIGLVSVISSYGINRYIEYSRTHHKLEDIIHEIQLTDDFNPSLHEALLHELYKTKIYPLIETVPKDQFPFKVNSSGKYQTAPNSYADQGEWIRAVALGYAITGDESYLKEAIERNEFLKITRDENGELTEMDERGINLVRIVRANMFLIDLIEESGLEKKYRGVRDELDAELREVVNIFIKNKYRESDLGGYFIMSSYHDENLPDWPGRSVIRNGAIDILEGMWGHIDKSLENKLFSHIRLSNKYLFRDDGSVRDAALVHNQNRDIIERNMFGWLRGDFKPDESTKSCYNWILMDFLMEMMYAYSYLNNEDRQITVNNIRSSLDFYIDNFNILREKGFFREKFVLPVDFHEPMLKNKENWSEIKINNYPLILSLKVLTDATDIIKDEKFRNRATDVLTYTARNLTRDISISKNNQGIIWGASDTERHLGEEAPNYYMFADANYLEYLHLIKNKN